MLRTQLVRRAGRLLGAVAATTVLSTVLLSAGSVTADAGVRTNANGVKVTVHHVDLAGPLTSDEANGI